MAPPSLPTPQPEPGPSSDPVALLGARFSAAIRAAFPEAGADADPLISPARVAGLGDFQSNAAMGLAKKLGMKPRDVAAKIVGAVDVSDIAEPITEANIAGPGFINITLRSDALSGLLGGMDGPTLGVAAPARPETVVVDLCGVNLAKQMHVGHLRSTIIGDALARSLARAGHRVVRQNHVGDWGLPIAMVTAKVQREAAAGRISLATLALDQLDAMYKQAQRECEADEAGLAAAVKFGLGPKAMAELEEQVGGARENLEHAKRTLIKLQGHDAEVFRVWKRIADVTMEACLANTARLNSVVLPEDTAGESSYSEELPGVVEDLLKRGIAEVSDGAVVVRLDRPEDGAIQEPCIIRKSDGGFLYATTDLAAIRRRVQKIGASRVIYCVDARQGLHFRQVFAAATRAGYATRPGESSPARLEHAAFGMVLGEDGRPFKTRSGQSVKLADLIDEAVSRAGAVVAEKNPALEPGERSRIAEAVGVAALRYVDLSSDRSKDYVFSFDRMLAFEGNTGPYLLYALVRVRSIFRKAAERSLDEGWRNAALQVREPAEKSLALALLRYPGVLRAVADTLEPHRLCTYLYELATAFSSFFDACPVLQAQPAERLARLRLCDLTARVLEDGLKTLGIPTLDRM